MVDTNIFLCLYNYHTPRRGKTVSTLDVTKSAYCICEHKGYDSTEAGQYVFFGSNDCGTCICCGSSPHPTLFFGAQGKEDEPDTR